MQRRERERDIGFELGLCNGNGVEVADPWRGREKKERNEAAASSNRKGRTMVVGVVVRWDRENRSIGKEGGLGLGGDWSRVWCASNFKF